MLIIVDIGLTYSAPDDTQVGDLAILPPFPSEPGITRTARVEFLGSAYAGEDGPVREVLSIIKPGEGMTFPMSAWTGIKSGTKTSNRKRVEAAVYWRDRTGLNYRPDTCWVCGAASAHLWIVPGDVRNRRRTPDNSLVACPRCACAHEGREYKVVE